VELSLRPALQLTSTPEPGSASRAAQTARRNNAMIVLGAALVALFLKLSIAYNTFGTNDVAAFYMFARSLNEHGLEWTYRNGVAWLSNSAGFNHPPLTAYYLQLIEIISRQDFCRTYGLTFPFLLRFPGVIADFVAALVVLRATITSQVRVPRWAMVLFALSPVSIMVSGFHGNTDPVMVLFLVVASYMCLRQRAVLCGVFFAFSCQIKVTPLLVFPVFFFFWLRRQSALRFTLPSLLLTVTMWSQPLTFPLLFVRNVLAYGSYWGSWGITYWLQLTGCPELNATRFSMPLAATIIASLLKAGILLAVTVMGWRRRRLNAEAAICSIAYAWIVFFVFSPGFCAYYLIWLAPFILILSPVFYTWLTATSSLFLFVFYNHLAGGLPWFIGVSRYSSPDRLSLLTPWSLWPWATLVCGMILLWKRAINAVPSLRLFSLEALLAERGNDA
jgi:hypothetical protein